MIPSNLLNSWHIFVPAFGNHLWQSTLFAAAAGALTFLFRTQQARTRYWLWLAASLKFLVPFSLLVAIGNQFAWQHHSAPAPTGLYFAMEGISKPFPQAGVAISPALLASSKPAVVVQWLAILVLATWACGFLFVVILWMVRWRRISTMLAASVPLGEGRVMEALRRLQGRGRILQNIDIRLSPSSLEPGIFGIAHPVLLWPQGISDRLEDGHLEAVLIHELLHVRRRDNLAAAVHMFVEAIFWFHPLVWWVGARLIEERERACDEQVLEFGSDRHVYAESILKVCEFCLGSPLPCVSGVTGADLKKRMVHIMSSRILRKMDFKRRLLLGVAGLLAIGMPIVFGMFTATSSRAQAQQVENTYRSGLVYDKVSIQPNRSGNNLIRLNLTPDGLSSIGSTTQMLIGEAYGVEYFQIAGGSAWLRSDKFDMEARMDASTAEAIRNMDEPERKEAQEKMLRQVLADRFNLQTHSVTVDVPVYALVVDEDGAKLHEADPAETYSGGIRNPDGRSGRNIVFMHGNIGGGPGHPGESKEMAQVAVNAQGVPISNLVRLVSQQVGYPVIDKTGLTGKYDFALQWTPGSEQASAMEKAARGQSEQDNASLPEPSTLSISTALHELGLKLEQQRSPVQLLVIDHVEKPAAN